jgi:hypothetical protein
MGGCTELVLNCLKIPMDVDEDAYMESHATTHILTGFMTGFETNYIRRCVIRDFDKLKVASDESTCEKLSGPSDEDELANSEAYQQHVELTDLKRKDERTKRQQSLYDYGLH